jgi:hypothetical protein
MGNGGAGGGGNQAGANAGASAVVSWGSRARPSFRTNDAGVNEL